MGLFGSGNPIDWANRSKCPPIDDCPVKNTVRNGRKPTRKQQEETAKAIAAQEAARKAKRSGKQQPVQEQEPRKTGWPFVSYDVKRGRGR